MPELRTEKGRLIAELSNDQMRVMLQGNYGKWAEKVFERNGSVSVYVYHTPCKAEVGTLRAGPHITLMLWEGYYIIP